MLTFINCPEFISEESCDNPCSHTYHGSAPASEVETIAVQNEAGLIGSRVAVWVSYHCQGRYWLMPYGNRHANGTCVRPEDYDDLVQKYIIHNL